MELIIGGCYQGKSAYAREKLKNKIVPEKQSEKHDMIVADGADCTWEQCMEADLLLRFQLLIRRTLSEESDSGEYRLETAIQTMTDLVNALLEKNPGIMIVCDEVGYGIVPAERNERDYREAVGRMLCLSAGRAESVERVTAGIPIKIK